MALQSLALTIIKVEINVNHKIALGVIAAQGWLTGDAGHEHGALHPETPGERSAGRGPSPAIAPAAMCVASPRATAATTPGT
jgi:hypothetical protein